MPLALKPHATSIERASSILEMLDGTRRGWNISEISRKQKIPKSSAHVIVLALERMGYLKRENGTRRYKLGLKICSLGRGLMNEHQPVVAARSTGHSHPRCARWIVGGLAPQGPASLESRCRCTDSRTGAGRSSGGQPVIDAVAVSRNYRRDQLRHRFHGREWLHVGLARCGVPNPFGDGLFRR